MPRTTTPEARSFFSVPLHYFTTMTEEDPLVQRGTEDETSNPPTTHGTTKQQQHPVIPSLVWISLNALALAASLFLAFQLTFALDDWQARPHAAGWYLVWNVGTTLLWAIEVSVRVYEFWSRNTKRWHSMTTVDSIELVVEWTFALLFAMDSIHLLIQWKVKKQDIEEDLIQVVLSVIAFGYITIATLQDYHEEHVASRGNDSYRSVGQGNEERIPNAETPLVV
jgi:hypothetical protein